MTKIKVKNGRWIINGKTLNETPFTKKMLFDAHIRTKLIEKEIKETKFSFKQKSKEVKERFNHVFNFKPEPELNNFIEDYPNINKLIFVPKNK